MRPVLAALCAAMLIPAVANDDPVEFPDDLEKWIAGAPPETGSDAWWVANHDTTHEWVVSLRDGRPRARLASRTVERTVPLPFEIERGAAADGLAGKRRSAKVADGFIVAFNAGEFGAGLWWFSPDGKKRYKIAEAWVKDFFSTEVGLLALEGLAHGGESRGRIIRLVQDQGGRWRSEDLIDLKHAPEVAVKRADGSLLVATTDRLLKVVPSDKTVEVLHKDAFWGGLYPSSLVFTPSDTIYLGMRHGVAKLEKKRGEYKLVWLLPNKEFLATEPRDELK
jgi:hypothetical protein